VREALLPLLPGLGFPEVAAVGGWWTRSNNVEIDWWGWTEGPVSRLPGASSGANLDRSTGQTTQTSCVILARYQGLQTI